MTYSDDILQIDTPENVTFDYQVAGIGSRFLAALVDTLLIFILQVLVVGVLVLGQSSLDLFQPDEDLTWVVALLGLVSFVFFWGYYIFFELLWNGQTPGKRWVSIRVIRLDGTPATVAEVVIRNLVRIIDLLPTAYGVGVVTMFLNSKSRRLGDLAAGTVVVHERPAELVENRDSRARALSTIGHQGSVPDGFPLESLRERDIQIIEDYLLRRAQLPNREQLAGHILAALYTRLGLEMDDSLYARADDLLAAVYKSTRALREV